MTYSNGYLGNALSDPDAEGVTVVLPPVPSPFTPVPGATVYPPDTEGATAEDTLPDDQAYIDLIKLDVGVPDLNDPAIKEAYDNLYRSLPTIWAMYLDKQSRGRRLRYLYAKRHALLLLRGHVWQAVDNTDGIEESLTDQTKNLALLYTDVSNEIMLIEGAEDGARGPMTGIIAREAPITPDFPGVQPNPNARVFRGDPLRRPWNRYGNGYGGSGYGGY